MFKTLREKAQLAIGLSTQQPALPADSLLGLWQQAVADSAERPAFTCLGQTLSMPKSIS